MQDTVLDDALSKVLVRIADTKKRVGQAFPHWADIATGEWTVTQDGDWTGGAWVGQLWLAERVTKDPAWGEAAQAWESRMRHRATGARTAFKGFGFFHAAVLGAVLADDDQCRKDALDCALDLASMYDERLGLIPLGPQAEESQATGDAESSIDSLQASPILLWAASELNDERLEQVAVAHTTRVLELHVRADGSVVQSTTLDPENGTVLRHHTHKGFNDTSTWGRAQAWAVLYAAQCWSLRPEREEWRDAAIKVADWWLANVPDDGVSYWDFDDPSIPHTERDTAATTITSAGLLKLADALTEGDAQAATTYRDAARNTVRAIAEGYLTTNGILTQGCFTKRAGARAHDAAVNVELIFGSYFLTECLVALTGHVSVQELNGRARS